MSVRAVLSNTRFAEEAPDLRLALAEDIPTLLAMMRQLYEQDGTQFREAVSRQGIEVWLESQSNGISRLGRIWLLEHHGEPVGYVVLAFDFSLEYGGRCGFIDELYLKAPYRGKGWGSWLLQYLVTYCRQNQFGALLLEAAHTNEGAARLYERFGFQKHERGLMSIDFIASEPHSTVR